MRTDLKDLVVLVVGLKSKILDAVVTLGLGLWVRWNITQSLRFPPQEMTGLFVLMSRERRKRR